MTFESVLLNVMGSVFTTGAGKGYKVYSKICERDSFASNHNDFNGYTPNKFLDK